MRNADAEKAIRVEVDRCVKCGLCLPECPTYRLASDENESPRGRLALIDGLVSGRLDADGPLLRHLDNCLSCRRCERVCPSQVRYGFLIDGARSLVPRRPGTRLTTWIQRPALLKAATGLARAIPPALSRPFPPLHRLHALARALPPHGAPPAPGTYPSRAPQTRGRVGLFVGCAGAAQQAGTLNAALELLQHAGYEVSIPRTTSCCGALAQHSGDPETAARLAEHTHQAFDDGLDAVISVASGCGIHIDSYRPALRAPHLDVSRFLLEQGGLTRERFEALPISVALHTPCSVENVYRGAAWARGLLGLIPELRVETVGTPGQCCGAAGDHMLRKPVQAARLRDPLLQQLESGGLTLMLTSNVGCAMHLAAGLAEAGGGVEVLHPVELLARQLRR